MSNLVQAPAGNECLLDLFEGASNGELNIQDFDFSNFELESTITDDDLVRLFSTSSEAEQLGAIDVSNGLSEQDEDPLSGELIKLAPDYQKYSAFIPSCQAMVLTTVTV